MILKGKNGAVEKIVYFFSNVFYHMPFVEKYQRQIKWFRKDTFRYNICFLLFVQVEVSLYEI